MKNSISIQFLSIIFFAVIVVAASFWGPHPLLIQPVYAEGVPVRFSTHTSRVVPFQLEIPENWTVENPPHSPNPYLIFVAWSPETQLEITLEHRDFGSLDQFKERVRQDIVIFPGVLITGEGETTVDRFPAYWFDYRFPTETGTIQGRLYLFSRQQGFYRVICLTPQGKFVKYLPVFEHVIQSFTFFADREPES